MIEEIRKLQIARIQKKRRRKRILLCILSILILSIIVAFIFVTQKQNEAFETTVYDLNSDKINGEFKIILMSDLHNKEFGPDNTELIETITELAPDIIIMCGDMVQKDEPDISVLMNLCNQLKDVADIYFIYGNHEGVLEYDPDGPKIVLEKYLMEQGVTVCYPGEYKIQSEQGDIAFFSASLSEDNYDSDVQLQKKFQEFSEQNCFKIVASHYPDMLYKTLAKEKFDLGVAGHYHGGLIIIPGLGGLYHADTGLFPKYYGGLYQLDYAQFIVTRGLSTSSIVPRINNKPELVLININKATVN